MNKVILLGFMLIIIPSISIAEEFVHWTATVKWVTVKENDSAWIGLKNPYSPNPNIAIWNCGSDIVWLGIKDLPASKNMLSTALTLYASQKTVRVGVRGTGDACEVTYLSARE